jgi:Uma2 family endonuclease
MAVKALFRAEDIEGIQELTGKKYELIKGELFEMTTAPRANIVTVEISWLITTWNKVAKAGNVGGDIGFKLESDPDTVRAPDVCFFRAGRLTLEQSRQGYPAWAPDLVVEVRSPNDRWPQLRRKAEQFLEHGARLVWLVEPDKFLEVYRPDQQPRRLELDDLVSAEDVLPGFSCRVSDMFPEQR